MNKDEILTALAEGRLTVEEAIKMLVAINKTEVAYKWTEMRF